MVYLESQVATDCRIESDGAEEEQVSALAEHCRNCPGLYCFLSGVYTNGFPFGVLSQLVLSSLLPWGKIPAHSKLSSLRLLLCHELPPFYKWRILVIPTL